MTEKSEMPKPENPGLSVALHDPSTDAVFCVCIVKNTLYFVVFLFLVFSLVSHQSAGFKVKSARGRRKNIHHFPFKLGQCACFACFSNETEVQRSLLLKLSMLLI